MARFILIFLNFLTFANSANILGLFHIPFYSHQTLPHKIFRELSLRGHNLTLFTTHKMNLEGLSNISQIVLEESVKIYQSFPNMMQHKRGKISDWTFYGYHQTRAHYQVIKNQIQHPEIQNLMNKTDQKFDLIITECYMCPLWMLGEVFKCPIVQFAAAEVPTPFHVIFGNDVNPSKYSEGFLPYLHNHLSFWQRAHAWTIYIWMEILFKHVVYGINQHLRGKYLEGSGRVGKGDIQVSMLLLNTNPHFGYSRAITPHTKQIGFAHVEPPKPLDDDDLKAFLDASDSVIVCFGSMAKTSEMGKEIIENFVKSFEKFPELNFVWKSDEEIENLPRNVKIFKWLKLADILAHPNVKIFISHSGLSSAYEAIDREVPMIVFPLSMDHGLNAKMLSFNKVAIELDLNSFTEEDLKEAIAEILKGNFKENVKKLKKIVDDVPKKPMEVIMESIEFVLRNGNFYNVKVDESLTMTVKVLIALFVIFWVRNIFWCVRILCK